MAGWLRWHKNRRRALLSRGHGLLGRQGLLVLGMLSGRLLPLRRVLRLSRGCVGLNAARHHLRSRRTSLRCGAWRLVRLFPFQSSWSGLLLSWRRRAWCFRLRRVWTGRYSRQRYWRVGLNAARGLLADTRWWLQDLTRSTMGLQCWLNLAARGHHRCLYLNWRHDMWRLDDTWRWRGHDVSRRRWSLLNWRRG